MHCKMLCIIGKLQAVRVSQLILVMPVTLVFFIKIPRQTSMSKSQRKPGAPSTDPPSALSQSGQLWGPQMLYTILYMWETTSLHSTQPEDAKDTALGCQKAAFKSLAWMGWKFFLWLMQIRVQNLIHLHPRISGLTSWHSFLGLAPHDGLSALSALFSLAPEDTRCLHPSSPASQFHCSDKTAATAEHWQEIWRKCITPGMFR